MTKNTTKKEPEKFKRFKFLKKYRKYLLPTSLVFLLIFFIILNYQLIISDKFYPFTFVGDTNISFSSKGEASKALANKFQQRANEILKFNSNEYIATGSAKTFEINLASSSAKIDYSALDLEFNNAHANPLQNKLLRQLTSIFKKTVITPDVTFSIDSQLEQIAKSVYKPYKNASLTVTDTVTPEGTPSAKIELQDGEDGIELDRQRLVDNIKNYLIFGKLDNNLALKNTPPKITAVYLQRVKKILENTLEKPITLKFEEKTWVLNGKQLLSIINLTEATNEVLDKEKVSKYFNKLASEIDQKVVEGQFEFDVNTKRVAIFKPAQEGRKLDQEKSLALLIDALNTQTPEITLPVTVVKPKIQTADVNNLGIKELIGRGISNFAGSIPNRMYNVSLTASKINGTLVPPGEVFSFNQTVGDISAATGFKQAYVIKAGRTVLDDGGGVCQDSTTLFRAVLNAGLPVVKRTAHAYRVGYYEQGFPPGLDATIYYPTVDFQFKNDSPAHVLIQAYTVGTTLYVDLYGTSDGRIVNLTTPAITNVTPAPPELRQDDPTLPKGTVKQVDFAARGATVNFYRTVVKGGETIISEKWTSNYKPWQAVYLVGTQ